MTGKHEISCVGHNKKKFAPNAGPSFPKNPFILMEERIHTESPETGSHSGTACFPKRNLTSIIKKYKNFKSPSPAVNKERSISIERLIGMPVRSRSRQYNLQKYPKFFKYLPHKGNNNSITSSEIWDSMETKNLAFEYLNDL
jgi:hypothetical protein